MSEITIDDIMNIDVDAELARRHHLDFIDYTWQKSDKFIIGHHTRVICNEIDMAIEGYNKGIDQFVIVTVPPRHGKTDIISRYLPPHFLGMFPESEVLVATYGQDLSNEISTFSRDIIGSPEYMKVYPDIRLNPKSKSIQNWKLDNGKGGTHWVGIGGGSTGRGYHLGIIDDFIKDRQDAESEIIREKQWRWFTDVLMKRRAPVSITFILATPWHVDDLIGRIKKKMKKDPVFPQFKIITLPYKSDDYEKEYLFLERFPESWYLAQESVLGMYGIASLLQCNPVLRGGNLLKTSNVKIIDESELPEGLRFVRGWDLASSEKQRIKQDPDYTVGVLAAIKWVMKKEINQKMAIIYIKDVVRIRSEAPERNSRIIQTVKLDGGNVRVGIETVAGYKDTYTIMKDILKGICMVKNINVSRDKMSRASALEPVFEIGNVYLVEGDWNKKFLSEVSSFPSGAHDDQVDGLVVCWEMMKSGPVSDATVSSENAEIKAVREVDIKERTEERGKFDGSGRRSMI